MLRISRLTDYGIVVMTHLAVCSDDDTLNARELASCAKLPVPVVSKLLKSLTRAGLLASHRGAKGGYSLSRPAKQISVVEMITALEGPVGITECTIHPGTCAQEPTCTVRDPWQQINGAITAALECVTLADLAKPLRTHTAFIPLVGLDKTHSDHVEITTAPHEPKALE
jgi:FeS assembly SUF system regulator